MFLNFAKNCVLLCLSNADNICIKNNFTMQFLSHKLIKLYLRVFLAGHTVATVTYCVAKMITTCLPMAGQYFDTMIVVLLSHINIRIANRSALRFGSPRLY